MKRVIKYLFCLLLFFAWTFVYAADDDDFGLSPESQEQVERQRQARDKYCEEGAQLSGCLYDKNNKLYTETEKISYKHPYQEFANADVGGATFYVPSGLPLIRGYQTFDGNGNAVFAGCYKYEVTNSTSSREKGTYFVFQIVYGNSNGKGCSVKRSFVVPANGLSICACDWANTWSTDNCSCSAANGVYSGRTQMLREWTFQEYSIATLNEWTAINGGDCPKAFGYTANTRWYTSARNKYIFSENDDDYDLDVVSFWRNEQYVGRPGCTVEDVTGREEAQRQLDGILETINKKQCPATIEEMSSFSEDFQEYYRSIRENNEYRVLWSYDLRTEVTKESAEQIKAAIDKKVSECQYKICGISDSQKRTIESNLGSECKNGCSLHSVKTPSDSENASCYCCGGSQGCTYQWSEEPKNSSNCSKQPNVPKGQCIGTSSDLACRQCLIRAYEKAGLSEEQQACLAGSEIAKLLTQKSLEDANTEAADQDLETEREENRELVEEIYERLARKGQKPAAVDFLFGQEPMSCTELLGPNLTAVVHTGIKAMQIIGAILAIVYGMMSLIPAIMAKDADGLKKAEKKLVLMAIILLCIFLLPYLARFIGNIFDFDISCIV